MLILHQFKDTKYQYFMCKFEVLQIQTQEFRLIRKINRFCGHCLRWIQQKCNSAKREDHSQYTVYWNSKHIAIIWYCDLNIVCLSFRGSLAIPNHDITWISSSSFCCCILSFVAVSSTALISSLAAAETRCVKLERQLEHMKKMLLSVRADRHSMLKEQVRTPSV